MNKIQRDIEASIRKKRPAFSNVPGLHSRIVEEASVLKHNKSADRRKLPPGVVPGLRISRAFIGENITILTTPTLIKKSTNEQAYMFQNPSYVSGLTSEGTHYTGTSIIADGNSQSLALGTANYKELHVYIDITAVSGTNPTLDLIIQTQSPSTANWVDVQQLFTSLNSVSTEYANIGSLGVASSVAFRWVIGGSDTPTFTFTIEYILKSGTGGSSTGLSQVIYFGGQDVNITTGFPLIERETRTFILAEGVDLYGIAATNTNLRIFEI